MEVLKRSNATSAALVDNAVRYILERLETDFFFPSYFSNQPSSHTMPPICKVEYEGGFEVTIGKKDQVSRVSNLIMRSWCLIDAYPGL